MRGRSLLASPLESGTPTAAAVHARAGLHRSGRDRRWCFVTGNAAALTEWRRESRHSVLLLSLLREEDRRT
nr:hypothetical protein Itr_chr02CG10670 [Ipomoea trifida]GLL19597.1 hypothetical protein Itr_chr02CG10680 [Ipomoea trifida]GLL41617.1 hypothetical protein Itr_chr12CG11620 [Ipomoea trifida]GLL41618.1 hypothetical protein Itr_chr12CG11630 [Ipomoea trifida]GMD04081.1 hypothetical protein Iba_chr06aCG15060 [Ipomoea batatas]